jgi:serine/threonine protein kinase
MKSRRASVRIESGSECVDFAVQMLEDEWRRHGDVHLESFWAEQNRKGAVGAADSVGVLVELVKADLRRRFDAGQRPTVGEYLKRFPELADAESRVLSLVYEEFCLCEERDGSADVDSFCDRYPNWKSSLESQIRCHRLISQAAGGTDKLPRFPKAGETFEEFQLVSLLGKGGTSRVFLARDLSLGGKHVALKVTLDRGQEPKIQGPLEFPHIVPVNSVTYQAQGRLCGLSMPYQPGLPLDEIIKRVKPSRKPTKALALWSALFDGHGAAVSAGSESIPAEAAQALPQGDGWKAFPARGTYVQGAVWIAMILARALHYAHGRGIFHRDVKPANILVTIDHGPQLLDFNLAESPHAADHAQAALRGGTLPYMAPEQIESFFNPERWALVGACADIYSLGLVLRELLTGQMPDLPKKGLTPAHAMHDLLDRRSNLDTALRRFNATIPASLEAIVAKCLALRPADRYPDAEALAKDLECFLNYQPLRVAVNPSRREQVRNYWVRHRRKVTRAALALVGVLLLGAALARPHEWLWPAEPSDAKFQAAVAAVEGGGDQKKNAESLTRIVKSYPRSCLARFYLAFALKDDRQSDYDAKKYLREAMAVADAERTVIGWAAKHREFCPLLVDFVKTGLDRADQLAEKYDKDDTQREEDLDSELRKPSYELFRHALLLAQTLDPASEMIQHLLAKTEQIFGTYEKSYDKLSEVIESLRNRPNSDLNMLFFCRHLRGRVAFLRVEQQRYEGVQFDDSTVKLLEGALDDLKRCNDHLQVHHFSDGDKMKAYRVAHDRLRATIVLAEVAMDLRLTDLAEKKLRAATGKLLVDLNDTARAAGLDKSTMESLKRRLKGATERHKEAARIAVRRTQPPAATVSQNSSYR